MDKRVWLIFYLIVLAIDLFAVSSGNDVLRYFSKPLLMPLLAGYFVFNTNNLVSPLKKWIILALLFSWLGDVLLMFDSLYSSFFIFGLVAFLIAHIFYILFYESILRSENLKRNYWLFIPVLIYYFLLIYLLTPRLGDMNLPVRVYGAVISAMLIQALQIGRIKNRRASVMMIVGAILFISSDSTLAINKFYQSFELAGIAIMITYGFAQLLIVAGAVLYISSSSTHKFAS